MVSSRFRDLHSALLVADFKRTRGLEQAESISEADVSYLMMVASRLALHSATDSAEIAEECQLAYDVAVRATSFSTQRSSFDELSKLILSRLGNFPAKALLESQPRNTDFSETDIFLTTECAVREQENSREDLGEDFSLTDFQVRLLDMLATKQSVSVSAPTSAGKSLALELELVRLLRSAHPLVAVFVVPTRALIRQVSLDILELVRTRQLSASVLTSPTAPSGNKRADAPRHTIFVLTQERLATLLAEAPPAFAIDAILVDEAHEIAKAQRGQILERVLQNTLRAFPTARIFFSSPLRSNPEYLLDLFNRGGDQSGHFIEYRSPVSQNLITLSAVPRKKRLIKVHTLSSGKSLEIGDLTVAFDFRGNCIADVVRHFTAAEETSIVYCNFPSSADRTAEKIAATLADAQDPELEDFAQFLEAEVHRLYKLASFVRKGVSFHYANIPQIVRGRIEELVKSRKIRFLCCTSTLLQGVNLPAKNIFIDNPKTGKGEAGAISRGDFWNLIGRAGRLGKEFVGNVYCLISEDWSLEKLIADRFVPIESAYQVAIRQRTPELAFYATTPPESGESGAGWAVQAFASIYADRLLTGQTLKSIVSDPNVASAVAEVDAATDLLVSKQKLPNDIFTKNLYVHPATLEELGRFLSDQNDILSWLPLMPGADSGGFRLRKIMQLIDTIFLKTGNNSFIYYSFLASAWMQGMSIRDLLKGRLDFQSIPEDTVNVNREARDLFREIEEQIRYVYVKYMSIYNQVLRAILIDRQLTEQAEHLVPVHLFLEFGASNQTLIGLMSLGLSRTSSLMLRSATSLRADLDLDQCRDFVARINLDRASIPEICKSEVRRVRVR